MDYFTNSMLHVRDSKCYTYDCILSIGLNIHWDMDKAMAVMTGYTISENDYDDLDNEPSF